MGPEGLKIERQDYKTRGSYVATVAGTHGIARLAYQRERSDLILTLKEMPRKYLKRWGG